MATSVDGLRFLPIKNHEGKLQGVDAQIHQSPSSQFVLRHARDVWYWKPELRPHHLNISHLSLSQESPHFSVCRKEPCPDGLEERKMRNWTTFSPGIQDKNDELPPWGTRCSLGLQWSALAPALNSCLVVSQSAHSFASLWKVFPYLSAEGGLFQCTQHLQKQRVWLMLFPCCKKSDHYCDKCCYK